MKDVLIRTLYAKYGRHVTRETIAEAVEEGLSRGLTLEAINTGLRMAFAAEFGDYAIFTIEQAAEALGYPEEHVLEEIEKYRRELSAVGQDIEFEILEHGRILH